MSSIVPSAPKPQFGDEEHPDTLKLPTEKQAKDYMKTGMFVLDEKGWAAASFGLRAEKR